MSFGWKPGFRRENGFKSTEKRRGRVIPCLGLRARLRSTALQILQQLFSLVKMPCSADTGGSHASPPPAGSFLKCRAHLIRSRLPDPSKFHPTSSPLESPENSPICQCISHLVLPFHTVSKPLWFCVVRRTGNCGMCEWEILCDVNCWDSSPNVSVFLRACYSVMFLLRVLEIHLYEILPL